MTTGELSLRRCSVREPEGQTQREVKEPVPWVMWWASLPGDDEFDGIPAALAVLHQDRHRIFPTRQRAGQWLARSLHHPHSFCATGPKNSPCAFNCPLIDSKKDKIYCSLDQNTLSAIHSFH